MRYILTLIMILGIVTAEAQKEDNRFKALFAAADRMPADTIKTDSLITIGGGGTIGSFDGIVYYSSSHSLGLSYIPDPCSYKYTAFSFNASCPDNAFHCVLCGKRFKKGESFIYVVTKVEGTRTEADYSHLRCSLKRIR